MEAYIWDIISHGKLTVLCGPWAVGLANPALFPGLTLVGTLPGEAGEGGRVANQVARKSRFYLLRGTSYPQVVTPLTCG